MIPCFVGNIHPVPVPLLEHGVVMPTMSEVFKGGYGYSRLSLCPDDKKEDHALTMIPNFAILTVIFKDFVNQPNWD